MDRELLVSLDETLNRDLLWLTILIGIFFSLQHVLLFLAELSFDSFAGATLWLRYCRLRCQRVTLVESLQEIWMDLALGLEGLEDHLLNRFHSLCLLKRLVLLDLVHDHLHLLSCCDLWSLRLTIHLLSMIASAASPAISTTRLTLVIMLTSVRVSVIVVIVAALVLLSHFFLQLI